MLKLTQQLSPVHYLKPTYFLIPFVMAMICLSLHFVSMMKDKIFGLICLTCFLLEENICFPLKELNLRYDTSDQFKYKWNKTKIIFCPFCHSFSQSFFVNDSSAIQTNNDIPRRFIVYDKKNRV